MILNSGFNEIISRLQKTAKTEEPSRDPLSPDEMNQIREGFRFYARVLVGVIDNEFIL